MWPEQAGVVALDVGWQSCKDEVDHVYLAVAVAVVLAEVNLRVGRRAGVDHQLQAAHALAAGVGLGLHVGIVHAAVDLYGSHDIERRYEDALGVVAEVVAHAACAGHLLMGPRVGVVRLVGTLVVILIDHGLHDVAVVLVLELAVVVFDEQYEPLEVGVVVVLRTVGSEAALPALCRLAAHLLCLLADAWRDASCELQERVLGRRPSLFVVCHEGGGCQLSVVVELCIDIVSSGVSGQCIAVGCGVVVSPLVALEADAEGGAVRLCNLCHTTCSRARPYGCDAKQHRHHYH